MARGQVSASGPLVAELYILDLFLMVQLLHPHLAYAQACLPTTTSLTGLKQASSSKNCNIRMVRCTSDSFNWFRRRKSLPVGKFEPTCFRLGFQLGFLVSDHFSPNWWLLGIGI